MRLTVIAFFLTSLSKASVLVTSREMARAFLIPAARFFAFSSVRQATTLISSEVLKSNPSFYRVPTVTCSPEDTVVSILYSFP